jgi:hypothetical protein
MAPDGITLNCGRDKARATDRTWEARNVSPGHSSISPRRAQRKRGCASQPQSRKPAGLLPDAAPVSAPLVVRFRTPMKPVELLSAPPRRPVLDDRSGCDHRSRCLPPHRTCQIIPRLEFPKFLFGSRHDMAICVRASAACCGRTSKRRPWRVEHRLTNVEGLHRHFLSQAPRDARRLQRPAGGQDSPFGTMRRWRRDRRKLLVDRASPRRALTRTGGNRL